MSSKTFRQLRDCSKCDGETFHNCSDSGRKSSCDDCGYRYNPARTTYMGVQLTQKKAVKMIELKTFETTHSNDEFEGHPDVGGYQVVVSGLLRMHFCAGDFVTPMYEEYEIAEISLTGGGYDNGAGIDMGVTSSLTPSMKDAILADVIEGLSKEQFVLKELWGDDE